MPIALTCAGCGKSLNVRDDLLGRAVKCPGCGASLPVGPQAARPAPVSARRDEDDADDRPRKKRKKKGKKPAGPNPALVAAAVIGGVLLVGGVVAAVALSGGTPKAESAPVAVAPAPAPVVAPPTTPAPAATPAAPARTFKNQGVYRAVDRARHGDYLRQIGLAMMNFQLQFDRGPKSLEELAPFYENNGKISESITEKDLAVVWNLPRTAFTANPSATITAYEAEPDGSNQRLVLWASGVVGRVAEADFPPQLRGGK